MNQIEFALLCTAALTGALVGRTLVGYGRAGLMASFGVGFASAVLAAFACACADLPRILPLLPGVAFPVGWSFVGAIASVGGPAVLVRALSDRPRLAPAAERPRMTELPAPSPLES